MLKTKSNINQFNFSILEKRNFINLEIENLVKEFEKFRAIRNIGNIYMQFNKTSSKLIWFAGGKRYQKPLFNNRGYFNQMELFVNSNSIDELEECFQQIFIKHKREFIYFERNRIFLNTESEINKIWFKKLPNLGIF